MEQQFLQRRIAAEVPALAVLDRDDLGLAEIARQADLIGLSRVLWADPQWPQKVREGREEEIIPCDKECGDTCMQLVMKGKPAFCVRWPHEKLQAWKARFV